MINLRQLFHLSAIVISTMGLSIKFSNMTFLNTVFQERNGKMSPPTLMNILELSITLFKQERQKNSESKTCILVLESERNVAV